MAGARALWVATGMKREQFGKPIIAIVNSFTQFVPGHTHLHEIGQIVKAEIENMGCFAAEFNTIAIDDGIGHHCRLGRIYGECPQGRRHDLHLELRQGDAWHADGFNATEYPHGILLWWSDGGRKVAW